METRGVPVGQRLKNRVAVARRSCDQCRSRKIGCDRGSPCSNCQSARVNCTHSAVASQPASSKQRILISAQYERKIDDIARDISGIQLALRKFNLPAESTQVEDELSVQVTPVQAAREAQNEASEEHRISSEAASIRSWDHSVHVIDFVRAVVERGVSGPADESAQAISSLRNLLNLLGNPGPAHASGTEADFFKRPAARHMPPLDAVIAVLRWAKSHKDYLRIAWICQILTLQAYEDVCRKVYFAVDNYTEVEFIVANGFLSYVFAEHALDTGAQSSRGHCQLARTNLCGGTLRLPYVLPASSEVIAALVFGALNSVENSNSTRAWDFVSGAMSRCQTLGYHCVPKGENTGDSRATLFWVVYRLERSLSHRLGRSSGIRDAEITLLLDADAPRSARVGRIQGQVHDQLYSPASTLVPEERDCVARQLANEVRELLDQIRTELSDATGERNEHCKDRMRPVYLHCDLVCHSSLLVLILRAIPTSLTSGVSEECILEARNALATHHQCMMTVKACSDPLLLSRYLNWAILHVPFVPFSILFTQAVQQSDYEDLARLEQFATSLTPQGEGTESMTHPYRLYSLLCQAARLYMASKPPSSALESTLLVDDEDTLVSDSFEVPQPVLEVAGDDTLGHAETLVNDSMDWYFGNQPLMDLFDDASLWQGEWGSFASD